MNSALNKQPKALSGKACPGNGDGLFAVYVHWPFCESKCPYCDFNSHVRERIDQAAWREAYLREIDWYADYLPGRTVSSVFFGGGTPTLMDPATAGAILDRIASRWTMSGNVEITLEANPGSSDRDKFRAFKSAGINRLSLGIQAMNDVDLKFLGRKHNVKEALQAIETSSEIFDRNSFDLIYARPGQTVDGWAVELRRALALAGGHLSLYQLTIEDGTPFKIMHDRNDFQIPNQDLASGLYEVTQAVMNEAGLPAYEVSNHAKAGHESLHNLTYWRYGDYAGIGPGAHGRLTVDGEKLATRAHRAPEIWLEKVVASGHGAAPFEPVDRSQRPVEAMMMGLRLREGLPLERLARESGRDWRAFLPPERIATLAGEGYVTCEDDILKATPAGLQRLNALVSYLAG